MPASDASAAAAPFAAGDTVFALHPEHSWVVARVQAVAPSTARAVSTRKTAQWDFTIVTDDPERNASGETLAKIAEWELYHCDKQALDQTPDDLLELTHLHDSTLLRCLYIRYMKDVVYTNIGAIVVALNPFNFKIPHYMDARLPAYLAERGRYVRDKLLPHSWAQAHNTYLDLCNERANQCILISGESGAGKTEATKIVLRYLAKISALSSDDKAAPEAVLANLIACSPVLESFGNARTVRNDNSSRFGKLMKVKFDGGAVVVGAHTTKYLLEKSRIVTAGLNERVYHAFYLTVRAPTAASDYLYARRPEDYTSIYSGKCLENSEFSTTEHYEEVCQCMEQLGMDAATIRSTWRIAAAVVHQSNVKFEKDGEGSRIGDGPDCVDALQTAADLFGVRFSALLEEYTSTVVKVPSKGGSGAAAPEIRKKLPPHQAIDARDALSKAVYDALFSQLVDRCNERCDVDAGNDRWIALLDIFGFEDFEFNSFEQLCINLANETLQGHYNEFIFKKDMEECRAEGIDVVDIKCPDNSGCIALVSGPLGILKLLDDECALGNGSDEGFYLATSQRFAALDAKAAERREEELKKMAPKVQQEAMLVDQMRMFYKKEKVAHETFIVHHYAGSVTYNVRGWLEKNRDTLKEALRAELRASSDSIVAALFDDGDGGAGSPKRMTVGGFFKRQLEELMEVINSTSPHWIRCIKPHPAKKPRMFGGAYTVAQLESSGVLGTVKIRKAGYPIRWKHKNFVLAFQPIKPLPTGFEAYTPSDWKTHAHAILKLAELDRKECAQMGTTRVFLKSDAYPLLEKRKVAFMKKQTIALQAVGKGYLRRLRLFRLSKSLIIQRAGRGIIERGHMFLLYCDKHREKIEAERRERERVAALIEDQRRVRHVFEIDAINSRAPIESEWLEGWKALDNELSVLVRQFIEQVRLAQMAEAQRREIEKQRAIAEQRKKALALAMKPVQDAETIDRLDVEDEEAEDFLALRYALWQRLLEVKYRKLRGEVMGQELRHRAEIAAAAVQDWPDWTKRAAELRRHHDIITLKGELEQQLESNRRRRAKARADQRERASTAPRSAVETMLVTTPQRGEEDVDTNGIGDAANTVDSAVKRGFTADDTRELAISQPVDLSPERLAAQLESADAERQRRVDEARHRTAFVDAAVLSGGVRCVELGTRVLCPDHHACGTVVELGPTPHGRLCTVFRVLLDNGDSTWQELDEVRLPLAGHSPPPVPPRDRFTGRRGAGSSSRSPSHRRSPAINYPLRSPQKGGGQSPSHGHVSVAGFTRANQRAGAPFSAWQHQMAQLEEDW